jgi:putative tributyrin esterase
MPYSYVEKSFPRYSDDPLHFLTFFSPALGGRGDVCLYIPKGHEERPGLPMVVLLHGVYGSHWSWALNGGAHHVAQRLIDSGTIPPVALVMPSDGYVGQGSGYVPHPGRDCEAWIMEDVIGCVRQNYPCFGPGSRVYLGGFSMGGFGALRLGAKYPARVSGIAAHSSVTHFDQLPRFFDEAHKSFPYLRDEDRSALYWLVKNREVLPPIYFDCGSDDILVQYNRELHQALVEAGVPHEYHELPGRHSWEYWHHQLADALRFLFRQVVEQQHQQQ